MELFLYRKLSTRSRRAIRRKISRFGRPYEYRPRGNLLKRLSEESGLSKEQVLEKLMEERGYLLSQGGATAL
jgi:hypothetical protein